MKVDREWHLKREAVRGQPRWQYEDVFTVEEVIKKFTNKEIPEGATLGDQCITWYGWPKDNKGPAEMWSLVNYEGKDDTPSKEHE